MFSLFVLVVQIAVILVVCRVIGGLFRFMRQPRVVGEMFAGIFLGPSVLGWLAPKLSAALFPSSSLGYLNALSQIGLIVFMFLVGMGLNARELKDQGHTAVLTSHVSIIFPFTLAVLAAIYLYPRLSDNSVPFMSFALFMGAAMSITAFPVLARILSEQDMLHTRLGTVAIACAAVDDVTGWCILAYIIVLVRAVSAASSVWLKFGGVLVFVVVMIFGIQPLLRRLYLVYERRKCISENHLAIILLLVLVSALCTEWLGVHMLFGAFLMGAIMPKDPGFVSYVTERLQTIIVVLLLPLFFAFTGLRTSVGLINGKDMWMFLGIILLVATAGKLGGSTLACWLNGMPLREAIGLGALMNTRGLMELVILNIGLDIKVISPALFSMMVLMALVTTFMTTPILSMVAGHVFGEQKVAKLAEAYSGQHGY